MVKKSNTASRLQPYNDVQNIVPIWLEYCMNKLVQDDINTRPSKVLVTGVSTSNVSKSSIKAFNVV